MRAGTACRLALFVVLVGGTTYAQYPGQQALAPASAGFQDKEQKPVAPFDLVKDAKESRAKFIKLPARSDVFAFPNDLELEEAILKRLRADVRDPKLRDAKYPADLRFPPLPVIGEGVAYEPKTSTYPPARVNYEPLYVVHRRLHFEELNAERYGWDFGIIQPFVSTAIFYKDVLSWPHSVASGFAHGFWDTNAGKCLPGSPTPYMLYPPGLTITGTVFEAGIITGAAFIFP